MSAVLRQGCAARYPGDSVALPTLTPSPPSCRQGVLFDSHAATLCFQSVAGWIFLCFMMIQYRDSDCVYSQVAVNLKQILSCSCRIINTGLSLKDLCRKPTTHFTWKERSNVYNIRDTSSFHSFHLDFKLKMGAYVMRFFLVSAEVVVLLQEVLRLVQADGGAVLPHTTSEVGEVHHSKGHAQL